MRIPFVAGTLVLFIPTLAIAAGVVDSSPNVNVRGAPSSIEPGEIEDSSAVTVFQETLRVSPGALPDPGPDQTGTLSPAPPSLNSYYFSLDAAGTGMGSTTNGTVTFSPNERVIAVYGLNDTINDNFYPIFQSFGTTYPTGNRGLEDAGELPQASSLDTNVLNLNDLTLNAGSGGGNVDQFRVVTANLDQPEKIANFDFGGSSADSNDTATNWVTSVLNNGSGLPTVASSINGSEGNPPPGIEITFGDFDYDNLAQAHAADGYYSFTVTPASGAELTYTDLSVDMFKTQDAGATVSATVFSSLGGFALGDEIGSLELIGTQDSGEFLPRFIDLSSLATATEPVEFRLYLDNGGASNNANEFRLDNIMLNASVNVVPEPSSVAIWSLIGLGLAGFGYCRIRRNR